MKRLTKTLQQAVPEARASQREGIEELKGALAGDVWDDLTDTHEEAQNLRARPRLMCQITDAIGTRGWTKAEAAAKCGITQVRVNDLLRGRISQFSLDDLANIAAALILSTYEKILGNRNRFVRRSGKSCLGPVGMKGQWRDSLLMGKIQNNTTRKHQHEVIALSERDRAVFVAALVNPSAPSKRLVQASQAYMETWKNKKR